jgi:glutathione S-transferase
MKPVGIGAEEQFAPAFPAVAPNNKIPAIIHRGDPGRPGEPVRERGDPGASGRAGRPVFPASGPAGRDIRPHGWRRRSAGPRTPVGGTPAQTPSVYRWLAALGARPAISRAIAAPVL